MAARRKNKLSKAHDRRREDKSPVSNKKGVVSFEVIKRIFKEIKKRSSNLDVRKILIILVAGFVIFSVSWMGLLQYFDDMWERNFISWMDKFVKKEFSKDQIRLIIVREQPTKRKNVAEQSSDFDISGEPDIAHRQYHKYLLEALDRAEARVVGFDIYFETDSQEWDEAFGNAIEQAEKSGTHVVVAVNGLIDGKPETELPEKLKNSIRDRYGDITVGGQSGWANYIRFIKLGHETPIYSNSGGDEIAVSPSFALQVVMQAQVKPVVSFFNVAEDQIHLRSNDNSGQLLESIPVDHNIDFLIDVSNRDVMEDVTKSYQEVLDNRDNPKYMNYFKDKIVLIGYEAGDLHPVSSSENRFGLEIQANVISNILNGNYIYKLRTFTHFIIILVLTGIGALVRYLIGARLDFQYTAEIQNVAIPFVFPPILIIMIIMYGLIAFFIFKEQRILLGMPYHLVALGIGGYWLTRLLLRTSEGRPGFRRG